MDNTYLKVLKDIFADNYIGILILTLGWIPFYFLGILIKRLSPMLFIRLPSYIKISLWRKKHMLQRLENYNKMQEIPYDQASNIRSSLVSFLDNIDRKSSYMLLNHKSYIHYMFPKKIVIDESKWIYKNQVCLLQFDLALLDSIMPDKKIKYTGILNLTNNPYVSSEISFNYLIKILEHSDIDFRYKVFYALIPMITKSREVGELEHIILNWPKQDQNVCSRELVHVKARVK